MGYTKEELKENLPDYINKKIEDTKLIEAIEYEISNNQDFKKEYDLISSVLSNFSNIEFSEPPENYFNNLLPRIKERITKRHVKFNLIRSLSNLWKFAVPVAAIILFFIGYKTIFKNSDYIDQLNKDTHVVFKELNHSDEKSDTSLNGDENSITEKSIYTDAGKETSSDKIKADIKKRHESVRHNTLNTEDNAIEDLGFSELDKEEIFFSEDDINYEQEFEKLSKEEQNEIILKIKNSNL